MRTRIHITVLFFLISSFAFSQEELSKDFQFLHENGEQQSLSDYRGKVVYLSFWASYCKPCLVNFQNYHEVRTSLQEMGVVLLNVNLDKDKSKWDQALMSYGFLNGDNVRVSLIREVMDMYNLSYIPAYEIINKSGYFVYLPEDSDRDIFSAFENWILE